MKTPQQEYPKLAKALGVSCLYVKREDLHPYASHKGRSIPLMMRSYAKQGIRDFAISSSGNAALAALYGIKQYNDTHKEQLVTLAIFVGNHVDEQKYATILQEAESSPYITVHQVERPKQEAIAYAKEREGINLRQSTDDTALIGYAELAQELIKIPDLGAVFVPTSSGTCAEALAQSFLETTQLPQVHIVQTIACHPMAKHFDSSPEDVGTSQAGAIVDIVAHRKEQLLSYISQTEGSGWIPSEKHIQDAIDLIKKHTDISPITANGALGVAGILKAKDTGASLPEVVCVVVTGR